MKRTPAPRGRAAVAAWPGRYATVISEPTEENLQRLCNLLDSVDRWVVEAWDKPSRDERRDLLDKFRAEARDAQVLVTMFTRSRQAAQGQAAARKRKLRPVTSPAATDGGDAA